ncbi:MAG: SurA N-terminal domain-containing protein, partial [Pyramidobacter sp.]|nr:SurA N-terminal domain-containing protein [Pyramidobacter sp.]
MSTRIWKLAALVLAMLLALTGCSLIEIDQEMDNAEAVATVNGVTITKGDVKNTYDSYVNYYNYLSSYYGSSMDTSTLKDDVIEAFINRELVNQKAAELGLDTLTDEDKATVEAQAAEQLDEYITEHGEDVNTDGMSEEEARAAVIAHLADEGITKTSHQKIFVGHPIAIPEGLRGLMASEGGVASCGEIIRPMTDSEV